MFAADTSNTSNASDGFASAEYVQTFNQYLIFHLFDSVIPETTKPPYFHTSLSVPYDSTQTEMSICDAAASFSEQKKSDQTISLKFSQCSLSRCEIIYNTRHFRQNFDIIKQRTIRICSLAKTLINVTVFHYSISSQI